MIIAFRGTIGAAGLFGLLFAGLGVLINDGQRVWKLGFFQGYTWLVIFIALLQVYTLFAIKRIKYSRFTLKCCWRNTFRIFFKLKASGGIIVAATMKYADNILKTFATSIYSIVLSCVLSFWLIDDLDLTPTFVLGTVVIIGSTCLYSRLPSSIEVEQKFQTQDNNKSFVP